MKQALTRDLNAAELYAEDDKFQPGRIFLGDISSDGFPDILVNIKYINGSSKSHILINDACTENMCSAKAFKAKRRWFNLMFNQYQPLLDTFDHVKQPTFFDLNENSMMDILLVR